MARLTIRTRLILLTCAGLFVLIATNAYLTKKLAENSAGMVTAADLLKSIEEANSAQIAFGEMRYWMTDLAVSQLMMAERNAAAARARVERHLDELAPWNPQRIAAVRSELAQYADLADKAVEEYTDERRVIGNSLLAQARQHSLVADELIASIVQELTGAAIAARQRVVAEAETATRLSQIVVAAAVVIGLLLTFLILRSIVVPLRRLTVAMDGLNAGNVAVAIPEAGRDEIGAMAQTLAIFRDTLRELRETLAQLEALRAVGRAVGSTLDLEAVLSIVVARAVEFSHAQAGMIYEFDEATREFRFRTSHGAEPALTEQLQAAPIRFGEGAISAAAVAGASAQVRDLLGERNLALPKLSDALARLGYRSLIAAPLLHEQDILGGLVVARREAGEFSKEVVNLIEAFATQSALAVRNAKLFEEQRRRERDLRLAHEQLKQAQANLIHAEKMASLGQLTAGIAHEIKNPLNFVNNFAELSRELLQELRDTIASPGAEQDELIATLTANLAKIVEHGRRADGIVTSMLSHSRGGTGERRATDLNALVEEALNLAFHGARARDKSFNITLERDLDAKLRPIELVPQDITRVLLNLVGNGFYAAEQAPGGGDRPGISTVIARDDAGPRRPGRDQGAGQRRRDAARGAVEAVHTVLHDQADRRRHRARPVDQLRHRRATAWRHNHRRQPPGRIHRIHDTAAARPAGCRAGSGHGSIGLSEMRPLHPDVEIVEATKAFERFLRVDVFRFRHRLFSGEWSALRSYDVLRRGQAASIVLYDPDRESVVLVEQFRLPALLAGSSPWQLETAAGLIDSGETPAAVAIRETQEETGLALIGEPIPIQRYLPSSGGSDESVFLFCGRVDATAAGGVHGLAEEHEDIRVVVKTLAEIKALLDQGAIESGHTLIGLYWLLRHRGHLRQLWAVD